MLQVGCGRGRVHHNTACYVGKTHDAKENAKERQPEIHLGPDLCKEQPEDEDGVATEREEPARDAAEKGEAAPCRWRRVQRRARASSICMSLISLAIRVLSHLHVVDHQSSGNAKVPTLAKDTRCDDRAKGKGEDLDRPRLPELLVVEVDLAWGVGGGVRGRFRLHSLARHSHSMFDRYSFSKQTVS